MAPFALISQQWSAASEVVGAAHQADHPTGAVADLPGFFAEHSPTLSAFYDSRGFDEFATWYAAHDVTADSARAYYAHACAEARSRVWMPPFTDQVGSACGTLADGGASNRALAFGPVLLRFRQLCAVRKRGTRPDLSGGPGASIKRPGSPYTESQWKVLDAAITQAVSSDCMKTVRST